MLFPFFSSLPDTSKFWGFLLSSFVEGRVLCSFICSSCHSVLFLEDMERDLVSLHCPQLPGNPVSGVFISLYLFSSFILFRIVGQFSNPNFEV